jgi:hypothetical protein
MRLVVDANVLFSFFKTADLLRSPRSSNHFVNKTYRYDTVRLKLPFLKTIYISTDKENGVNGGIHGCHTGRFETRDGPHPVHQLV